MKKIIIDINNRSSDFITAVEDDNNSDVYKIILTENNEAIDLTDKTVRMAYILDCTTERDIIDLNITNPTEGEITLVITETLTRKEGNYSCQLLILGANDYRKHSNFFKLYIGENIFSLMASDIISKPTFSLLQELLKKAETLNTELTSNVNSADKLNSSINKNIVIADKLTNSLIDKLQEATKVEGNLEKSILQASSKEESLKESISEVNTINSSLENNINSAKEINTNLDTSLDQANTTITEVTQKKEELENTIDEADTINDTLRETIEESKLAAIEATSKNKELKDTLEETLEVINNLDESQNLPKIRADLTEVQNGLKLNQALEYKGYSIEAENTLVGRTEKMIIKGLTLQNLLEYIPPFTLEHDDPKNQSSDAIYKKIGGKLSIRIIPKIIGDSSKVSLYLSANGSYGFVDYFTNKYIDTTKQNLNYITFMVKGRDINDDKNFIGAVAKIQDIIMLNRNVANPPFNPPNYFTGIKSFGEEEKEGNKYKITIVSCNEDNTKEERKNIFIKEPLRGFDENVCDILHEDEGQVKVTRVMEEYTFTGNENWQMFGRFITSKKTLFFYTDCLDGLMNPGSKIICNNFIYSLDDILNTDYSGIRPFILEGKEYLGIRINWEDLHYTDRNLEGFKKWLRANKTTIVYQALNPKIEIVENCIDIDLDTYSNKTYFRIENSLPGLLDFKVPSNIASIVQSNAKAINELDDRYDFLVSALLAIKKDIALKTIKNDLKK
ncbi:DUF2479 domain-containing protein [Clostridium perfringens]|nr:DUF2479 domain-containing protein [Clostridium perfringens]